MMLQNHWSGPAEEDLVVIPEKDAALARDPSLSCEDISGIMDQPRFVILRKGFRLGDSAETEPGAWASALRALRSGF